MRWRQVAVLYAVAALLAAEYVRGLPQRATAKPDAATRPRVLAMDAATLSEIAIQHGGRRIVARRSGDGWEVHEPPSADVPSDLVKAFATALLEAEEIERVGTDHDLAAFGLDDDRATRVELRRSGGPPETLWIGGANPSGTAVYARRLGRSDVILVGRTLRYYEELILQALPRPAVPADTVGGPVG
jgi:hypothetical protein